jgi:hypothetical protein
VNTYTNTRTHEDECPSVTELAEYVEGSSGSATSEIAAHIERCERCRAVVTRLRDADIADAPSLSVGDLAVVAVPQRRTPETWAAGQIAALASAYAPDTRLLGVVIDPFAGTGGFMEVAPISTETGYASAEDVIVPAQAATLGYDVIVELWNHGTVLHSQVVEKLGVVSDELADLIGLRYVAMYEDEAEAGEGDKVRGDGADVETREASTWSGPPIIASSDPRAVFQEAESQRARPFWRPAAGAMSGDGNPSQDAWEEMTAAAVGVWLDEPFPVDEIALALVSAPEQPEEIEAILVERLSALVAGSVTKLRPTAKPSTVSSLAEDLALAAGSGVSQYATIRTLAAQIRHRVEELRQAPTSTTDHQ